MAYREVSRVEIAEVVRRWQSGNSQRQIATGTGLSRATVRRYIVAAMGAGLTRDGCAPSEEQLARLAGVSLAGPRKVEIPTEDVLAPWADQVYEWLTADRLQVTRIHELLAGRGCRVSYTSLRRFIQRRGWQRRSPATVRMGESAPGEVAEMDFGRLGLMEDPETGRRRVAWALIIVLTYSRHIPDSREASWSTPSAAASSQTRRGCAIPGTSRAWSVGCPTCGSGSSRAGSSRASRT